MSKHIVLDRADVRRIIDLGASAIMRPMRPQPVEDIDRRGGPCWLWPSQLGMVPFWEDEKDALLDYCPFGDTGDVLWAKEPWAKVPEDLLDEDAEPHPYIYQATDRVYLDGVGRWRAERNVPPLGAGDPCTEPSKGPCPRWRRAVHMPNEAVRLHLHVVQVNAVRVRALLDEADLFFGYNSWDELEEDWRRRWRAGVGDMFADPWVWTCHFSALVKAPLASVAA